MPESAYCPEGIVGQFLGGFTVPTPAPGGWGGSGTESTLGLDPLPALQSGGPQNMSQAVFIAWNTGTMRASVVFETKTNNPGTVQIRVYRAAPTVSMTGASQVATESVAAGGGPATLLFQSIPDFTVTQRDRILFTLEHNSSGPGVAWGTVRVRYV
jgi:hypothetical protein